MTWRVDLICPIARHNTWEEMWTERDDRIRYSFGAEKFLHKYGYCKAEVEEAFQIYEENGYGQMMIKCYPVLHKASKAALIAICENAQYLHHFRKVQAASDETDSSTGNNESRDC